MQVIIIQAVRTLNCPLKQLKQNGFEYVLIAGESVLESLSAENCELFNAMYSLPQRDFTPDALAGILEDNIKEEGAKNVRFVTSDESMIPVLAALRKRFNVPGNRPDETLRFSNKLAMHDCAEKGGIHVPRQISFNKKAYIKDPRGYMEQLFTEFDAPFIVKPVSLTGTAGFAKIIEPDDLINWADVMVEKPFEYLVAEFVEGELFHLNSLVKKGKVVYREFEEYINPTALFGKGKILGGIQLLETDPRYQDFYKFNEKVIATFVPPDGGTHLEVFRTPDNELVFLEIAARMPGCLIPIAHAERTGIHFEVEHFKGRLGVPFGLEAKEGEPYNVWALVPKKVGVVKRLIEPKVKSRCVIEWRVKEGENVGPAPLSDTDLVFAMSNVAAVIMLYNDNYAELYEDFLVLRDADLIEVK